MTSTVSKADVATFIHTGLLQQERVNWRRKHVVVVSIERVGSQRTKNSNRYESLGLRNVTRRASLAAFFHLTQTAKLTGNP